MWETEEKEIQRFEGTIQRRLDSGQTIWLFCQEEGHSKHSYCRMAAKVRQPEPGFINGCGSGRMPANAWEFFEHTSKRSDTVSWSVAEGELARIWENGPDSCKILLDFVTVLRYSVRGGGETYAYSKPDGSKR